MIFIALLVNIGLFLYARITKKSVITLLIFLCYIFIPPLLIGYYDRSAPSDNFEDYRCGMSAAGAIFGSAILGFLSCFFSYGLSFLTYYIAIGIKLIEIKK
ncbi:hypothetical protein N8482_01335 [Chitinophagales bacterium]|nr:hypothetical protein [Chitinophagales bacterium]